MRKLARTVAIPLLAAAIGQQPASRTATPVEQELKLPPFPKADAKWVVRGKARIDASVATGPAPGLRYNATDLTLPCVAIEVQGAGARWQFEPVEPVLRISCTAADRFLARVVRFGQTIELVGETPGLSWDDKTRSAGRMFMRGTQRFGLLLDRKASGWRHDPAKAPAGELSLGRPSFVLLLEATEEEPIGRLWPLTHPLGAITDEHGRFALPALPDGDYQIVATHELLGQVTHAVTIAGANPRPITFVFKAPEKVGPTKK